MFKTNAITLDFKCVDRPRTKADFTYQISPNSIEIVDTGRGELSVADDLNAVMRRIEYWHMGSVSGFKISYRDEDAVRHEVQWDGQRVQGMFLVKLAFGNLLFQKDKFAPEGEVCS